MAQPSPSTIFISSDSDTTEYAPPPKRSRVAEQRHRRWCYTINNPEEHGYSAESLLDWNARYHVFQLESGSNNTIHFQGLQFLFQLLISFQEQSGSHNPHLSSE